MRARYSRSRAKCHNCGMTLTISLPSDSEKKLVERARAAGQAPEQYAAGLLARELEAPLSLVEAAEPLARAVDTAGASDEQFTEAITEALQASRRQRRERQ